MLKYNNNNKMYIDTILNHFHTKQSLVQRRIIQLIKSLETIKKRFENKKQMPD